MAGGAGACYRKRKVDRLEPLRSGLPVLGNLPWHALQTTRVAKPRTYLCLCSIEIPQQSCLQLQGNGVKHGEGFQFCYLPKSDTTQGTMICGWDKTVNIMSYFSLYLIDLFVGPSYFLC